MMKQCLIRILAGMLLLPFFFAGAPALAAREITDLTLTETETGVAYSFSAPYPYMLLHYKTADESGKLVLTGRDGRFEGDILLAHRQKGRALQVDIKRTNGQTVEKSTMSLSRVNLPAARKAEKDAVIKVTDLTLTAGKKQMDIRFTAPGHHQVVISYSSVLQKGEYVLEEQSDGVFEDSLVLPCANARDMITVTVKSLRGKNLAKAQERTAFVPPDAGETAAEGPLKGIKVCIDPGHQELKVNGGQVYQYPGAGKLVSGGNSSMAQGAVTLRKESICVLEISYHLCRLLREQGAEVVMTRWVEEVSITNMERAEYANEQKADYCFRIHLNASQEGNNNAIYVYGPSHSPYARALMPLEQYRDIAQTILDAMKATTGVKGGVVRMSDQFVGNNWTKMVTFLLECGFLSTPFNDWILTTEDYQEKIARGIVDGLINTVEGRLSHFETH